MNRIKIIDGNSLLFRSFYALYNPSMDKNSLMRTKSGIPINAIFIFHKFIRSIRQDLSGSDRIVVCFDTGKKTFRKDMLDAYKKQRKPIEPELLAQLPIARELLDSMNIYHCELDGYEADDLAGSLATLAKNRGDEVILYTSDKDYLQLIDTNVTVNFLRKGLSVIEVYNKENILEKFGVRADQICDYKGLVGDASDNFKGIPGVGEKTACKLLSEYDSLEEIISGMEQKNSKLAMNILEHQEEGRFCKKLAQMVLDLDVEKIYSESIVRPIVKKELISFYKKYDFKKFLEEFLNQESLFASGENLLKSNVPIGFKKPDYDKVKIIKKLDEIHDKNFIGALFSYDGKNYHLSKIKGLYLLTKMNIYFVAGEDIRTSNVLSFFEDENNTYITFDEKALCYILARFDVENKAKCVFDLLLATYLIDTNVDDNVKSVLESYGYSINSDVDIYQNAIEALVVLKDVAIKKLEEEKQMELYYDIEVPLARVLAKMELRGVPLDLSSLAEYSKELHIKLDNIKNKILSYSSHEINLNSPKQVSSFLYEELGIKKVDKKGSTSNDVLLKIRNSHPVIAMIMEYRKYSKLIQSYTDALPNNIYPDNRLHAIFNQALTTTGRLSMSEPNLQNISIRDEEGKEIRKSFFYPDTYSFLSYDYSQIELRLLAHLSEDEELIQVFNSGKDIHTMTAAKLFGKDFNDVTSLERRIAKTVNFSIVYGTTSYGLSEKLEITVGQSKMIIDSFYNTFKKIKPFEESCIEFAKNHGFVTTMLNRRRYLPDINSSNFALREFSKRAAVNAVVQGSAADLIKKAMIDIENGLKGFDSEMILQIHDELVFKVRPEEVKEVEKIIKEKMENALKLKVPLVVEGSLGASWYEAK